MFFSYLCQQPLACHMSGHAMIQEAARASGVSVFTEADLRKVFAKTMQMLATQRNTLRKFAKFRGRFVNMHRECYRLQDEVFECTRLVKVFLQASVEQSLPANNVLEQSFKVEPDFAGAEREGKWFYSTTYQRKRFVASFVCVFFYLFLGNY